MKLKELQLKEQELSKELEIVRSIIKSKKATIANNKIKKAMAEGFVLVPEYTLASSENKYWPDHYYVDKWEGWDDHLSWAMRENRGSASNPANYRWHYGKTPPAKIVDHNGNKYVFDGLHQMSNYDEIGYTGTSHVAQYKRIKK